MIYLGYTILFIGGLILGQAGEANGWTMVSIGFATLGCLILGADAGIKAAEKAYEKAIAEALEEGDE